MTPASAPKWRTAKECAAMGWLGQCEDAHACCRGDTAGSRWRTPGGAVAGVAADNQGGGAGGVALTTSHCARRRMTTASGIHWDPRLRPAVPNSRGPFMAALTARQDSRLCRAASISAFRTRPWPDPSWSPAPGFVGSSIVQSSVLPGWRYCETPRREAPGVDHGWAPLHVANAA